MPGVSGLERDLGSGIEGELLNVVSSPFKLSEAPSGFPLFCVRRIMLSRRLSNSGTLMMSIMRANGLSAKDHRIVCKKDNT